ncbi:hypothetical protein BT93_G0264 [Corymbia citriodora subsp. variegata]|nr:hypothetical protein BT93_G0264 [Corymbia citriodora subsp. variegata]
MAILFPATLSFSELPSLKIPPFSSISHSPALLISSRIRRRSSTLVARYRRRARRKNPPEQLRLPGNDMSATVQMPAAPRRWDKDLNSMGNCYCVDFFLPDDYFHQFTPIMDAFVFSLRNL